MWHLVANSCIMLRLCDLSIRDPTPIPTRINKVFLSLLLLPVFKDSVGERKEWLAQSFVVLCVGNAEDHH